MSRKLLVLFSFHQFYYFMSLLQLFLKPPTCAYKSLMGSFLFAGCTNVTYIFLVSPLKGTAAIPFSYFFKISAETKLWNDMKNI